MAFETCRGSVQSPSREAREGEVGTVAVQLQLQFAVAAPGKARCISMSLPFLFGAPRGKADLGAESRAA